MRDIARFFVRYQIDPENLLYLTREEQRTVLHLLDGSTVTTSMSIFFFPCQASVSN